MRSPIILMSLLALAPPASGQDRMPAETTCFDIRLGEWNGTEPVRHDSLRYTVPPRILIRAVGDTTESPSSGSQVRGITVPADGLSTPHSRRGWQALSPDSARLFWTDGFTGVEARVAVLDSGLVGKARTVSDAGGSPFVSATIEGTRVHCDSPLQYRLGDQRRLLRGVALSTGEGLALGVPVSDTSGFQLDERRFLHLTGDLGPPFNGVVESYVHRTPSGMVRRMRFWYASAERYSQLRADLIAANGRPVTEYETEWGSEGVQWANRTTEISLTRFGPGHSPGRVSLIIEDRILLW